MSDLIDDPKEGLNAPEFSVSEISGVIKRMIEGEFSHVRIKGEIGRVMRARSGHVYYDLKDEKAVINAVTWKGQAAHLATQPEEGIRGGCHRQADNIPRAIEISDDCQRIGSCGCGCVDGAVGKTQAGLGQ